jgi:hypothetical protein
MRNCTKNILIILCLPILFGCKINNKKIQISKELDVYSDLIDTLYTIEYCHLPMISRENWPNCDSNYIASYKREMQRFHKNLDSLKLTVYIFDSLTTLDLSENKNQLLGQNTNQFIDIINSTNKLFERKFDVDSIKQKDIEFIGFNNSHRAEILDCCQIADRFIIGNISLSRVLFDSTFEKAIFEFSFTGGPKCGYTKIIFTLKVNGKWRLYSGIIKEIS